MELLQSCTKLSTRRLSQNNGNSTVCSTHCSGWQERNHQSSTLLLLCEGNPAVAGGFPSQRASNVESIFMSGHDHEPKDYFFPCNGRYLVKESISFALTFGNRWRLWPNICHFNSPRPRKNGCHILYEICLVWLRFYCYLFLRVQLTISHNWLR